MKTIDVNQIFKSTELKILETHQRDFIGDDIHHFEVKIAGTTLSGFGSHAQTNLARTKAYGELAERIVLRTIAAPRTTTMTSNGFASHFNIDLAKVKSACELIERDLVLANWLTTNGPAWIVKGDLPLDSSILKTVETYEDVFQKHNCQIKFGILGKTNDTFGLCSVIIPNDPRLWGFVYTSCGSLSIESALESLYFDQRRALTIIENRKKHKTFIYKAIHEENIFQAIDHLEFYLNPNNCFDLDWFFNNKGTTVPLASDATIRFDEYKLINFFDYPIYVAHAKSDDLQTFYTGTTKVANINRNRIRPLLSRPFKLQRRLHPLA